MFRSPTPFCSLLRRTSRLLALSAGLASSGFAAPAPAPSTPEFFAAERTYLNELFETPEDCARAKAEGRATNCTRWIHFSADGKATVGLDETLQIARYELQGQRVIVTLLRPTSQGLTRLELRLAPNRRHLVDATSSEVWEVQTRVPTESPRELPVSIPAEDSTPALPPRHLGLPSGGVVT